MHFAKILLLTKKPLPGVIAGQGLYSFILIFVARKARQVVYIRILSSHARCSTQTKGLARKLSDTKNHIKELETALNYIDQVKKNHPIKEPEKTISIHQTREKRIIRTHDLEL